MNKYIFLAVLFTILISQAYSQTKYEREFRLKMDEVPGPALSFVPFDELDTKVRWYYEENLEGNSIEAKFKFKDRSYSIEFDTAGQFQDIEVEMLFSDLTPLSRQSILNGLDSVFSKYKIRKLQYQYSGDIASFSNFLDENLPAESFLLQYELVVKGRIDKQWNLHELTFSKQGRLLKSSRIIFRNTDNLEF